MAIKWPAGTLRGVVRDWVLRDLYALECAIVDQTLCLWAKERLAKHYGNELGKAFGIIYDVPEAQLAQDVTDCAWKCAQRGDRYEEFRLHLLEGYGLGVQYHEGEGFDDGPVG